MVALLMVFFSVGLWPVGSGISGMMVTSRWFMGMAVLATAVHGLGSILSLPVTDTHVHLVDPQQNFHYTC